LVLAGSFSSFQKKGRAKERRERKGSAAEFFISKPNFLSKRNLKGELSLFKARQRKPFYLL
jgi:hypothetical protein